MKFGRFYLDREKDIIVDLTREGKTLSYVLSTPNHHTGNLITNLARLCDLPISLDEQGLKVIHGEVPCYVTADGSELYIFRLGGTKVANIFPDGRIEMKASIPSISKILMSQTKNYSLPIEKTIIKTYILSDCKFHTDLHTHMNGNLAPDVLIALGIYHQIRYPLYYIKKLSLRLTANQQEQLFMARRIQEEKFKDSGLAGKYLDRKIDDNTFINFADFILKDPDNAAYNIPRIRASLSVMKDGQAVFTNLEKVYLYRYVFTRGISSEKRIRLTKTDRIPDQDIRQVLQMIIADHETSIYGKNTLFQDKLLWIARSYAREQIYYVEISDTSLVKKDRAPGLLSEVHEIMPKITKETGVMIRFLAGIRRIPLTIVKDRIAPDTELKENLQVLRAVSKDPYVAGSDILGEEINDIRQIRPVISEIVSIAKEDPSFVVRIHAGENDALRDNVANSIRCVENALAKGQKMPKMRVGHGLYTSNLSSAKGKALLAEIKAQGVVLEFQITSNVRLNNLSEVTQHPLKSYLSAGVDCVQGTDGAALYGTDPIDEQLSLEKLLELSHRDLLAMNETQEKIRKDGLKAFQRKKHEFEEAIRESSKSRIEDYYSDRIHQTEETAATLIITKEQMDATEAFKSQIREMPEEKTPIIICGGSFNNDRHRTIVREEEKRLIDELLDKADPEKVCFVIGHKLSGHEKYLTEKSQGRFEIYAFVPARVDAAEQNRIRKAPVSVRVAIEPSSMGLYKSIAYEVFKRRPSILLAFDGNASGANMIQEARNAKKKCRTFVNPKAKSLRLKADSLEGYITWIKDVPDMADQILKWTMK